MKWRSGKLFHEIILLKAHLFTEVGLFSNFILSIWGWAKGGLKVVLDAEKCDVRQYDTGFQAYIF